MKETASSDLDMAYLADCIQRQKRQIRSYVEDSPASCVSDFVTDFLFGAREGSTLRDLTSLQRYDDLTAWNEKDWRDFLDKWLANAAHISILGVPSAKMSEKIKVDEKTRIEERKAKLGPDGLRELEKILEDAKKANDVEIPRSLLEKFTIPSTDSIHFISTTTARSGLARTSDELQNPAQDIIDKDGTDLPLFLHFENVGTSFVYIAAVISTEAIPVDKRPLLSLYMDNFFDTPIRRHGEVVPFEKVVTELERDTISYSIQTDEQLDNSETFLLQFRVERDKYEQAIRWLEELFWDSVFDEEVSLASPFVWLNR